MLLKAFLLVFLRSSCPTPASPHLSKPFCSHIQRFPTAFQKHCIELLDQRLTLRSLVVVGRNEALACPCWSVIPRVSFSHTYAWYTVQTVTNRTPKRYWNRPISVIIVDLPVMLPLLKLDLFLLVIAAPVLRCKHLFQNCLLIAHTWP